MAVIQVVVVDDHRIVRQGIRSILDPDPRFEVMGEAATGAEACRLAAEKLPDVVLLDLNLPDIGGVEVCRRITQTCPKTAILVLTVSLDWDLVNACLQAGARGYLLKDAENLRLRDNIIAVVQGYAALDPRAATVLTEYVRRQRLPSELLTLRELEILRLIAQGLTNKEIGSHLHLSGNTIKGHVKDILAKLNAQNRVEAVIMAKERKLI